MFLTNLRPPEAPGPKKVTRPPDPRALGDSLRALGDSLRALGDSLRALADSPRALGDSPRALRSGVLVTCFGPGGLLEGVPLTILNLKQNGRRHILIRCPGYCRTSHNFDQTMNAPVNQTMSDATKNTSGYPAARNSIPVLEESSPRKTPPYKRVAGQTISHERLFRTDDSSALQNPSDEMRW